MKKLFIFVIMFSTVFVACKNDKSGSDVASSESKENTTQQVDPSTQKNPYVLPDPCSLLDENDLAEFFNMDDNTFEANAGNMSNTQDYSSSCFFTYQQDGEKIGFLLQLMKNPLYGEFDQWAESYINVLATKGETSFPDNISHVYERFDGLGDEAVYSEELGKLFWRKGDNLIVGMIVREEDQKKKIKKIGKGLGELILKKID